MEESLKKNNTYTSEWTEEEDEKLRDRASMSKQKNWNLISEYIGTKSPLQCQHRWKNEIGPDVLKVKGRWTAEVCSYFDIKLPPRALSHILSVSLSSNHFLILNLNHIGFSIYG